MAIWLVISAYHILLHNRMGIFHASWYALPVDVILIKENVSFTICVCRVYHHMGYFHANFGKKAFYVHHYQGELLVTVNYNWFATIFCSMSEVNEPVSITIKATCFNTMFF